MRDSDVVVLLQTAGVLSRPWCLVEILTALEVGVHVPPFAKALPDEYWQIRGKEGADAAANYMRGREERLRREMDGVKAEQELAAPVAAHDPVEDVHGLVHDVAALGPPPQIHPTQHSGIYRRPNLLAGRVAWKE